MSAQDDQHIGINPRWLAQRAEPALDPSQPIIDAHHHIWDAARQPPYRFDDLLSDFATGHNIIASVFVECRAMYRAAAPASYRSVGETEFANGLAAMSASGLFGPTQVASTIVSHVDLMLGDDVGAVLAAHRTAGGARLRGVRDITAFDPAPSIRVSGPIPKPGKMSDPQFRRGFAHLAANSLSFDAWVYHPQLAEVAELAAAFPDTRIVVNHCGGPLRIGPYADRPDESFANWRGGIRQAARYPNVFVKLGGLAMKIGGFAFDAAALPPSSEQLAQAWRPYVLECIDAFTPGRCMFGSNFPVDKGSCSFAILWNSFKRIAQSCSGEERNDLFYGTAARFYRLREPLVALRQAILQ